MSEEVVFKSSRHARWFTPQLSLGHLIQVITVIIPAIFFWVRLDAKVNMQAEIITRLIIKEEKLQETTTLLAQNQAVLTALFQEHKAHRVSPLTPPKSP